ncbi:unnamed protein product [Cyprideis torosa]|uniref:Uncharacterized protein n=1 Tax=Cyprideis torosa TaxID=163714 RepID=A0A7R8WWD0_9CRUS|nr:unnamed protein product [Cyprideis torosa]CAG0910308.1 unnamed protein product [Cyprideis torosa]
MNRICVFDAYGTLFDVAAAARLALDAPGQEDLAKVWPQLADDWRRKQLEYSWLRAITGDYIPFWDITKDGLDWAMQNAGLDDPVLRETLLALYWELSAYKEVPMTLARLKAAGHQCAILSNGSPDMLDGAVDSAGIGMYLDALLSVEAMKTFKPARAVYDLVRQHFQCDKADVLFVSSNGWDVAGASAYGFETVWVNRAGAPTDRLMAQPTRILTDLTPIPDIA